MYFQITEWDGSKAIVTAKAVSDDSLSDTVLTYSDGTKHTVSFEHYLCELRPCRWYPRITSAEIDVMADGLFARLLVCYEGGEEKSVGGWYTDERFYLSDEFVGLTEKELEQKLRVHF